MSVRRTVVAVVTAQSGKETELKARLEGVARESWEEPGVISYAVHDLADSPGSFMMVEVYESDAAFDAHLETPHVKALLEDMPGLADGELTVFQGHPAGFAEGPKGRL